MGLIIGLLWLRTESIQLAAIANCADTKLERFHNYRGVDCQSNATRFSRDGRLFWGGPPIRLFGNQRVPRKPTRASAADRGVRRTKTNGIGLLIGLLGLLRTAKRITNPLQDPIPDPIPPHIRALHFSRKCFSPLLYAWSARPRDGMKWDWATVLIVVVVGIAVGESVRLLGQAVAVLQQIRDILQSVTSGPPKHFDRLACRGSVSAPGASSPPEFGEFRGIFLYFPRSRQYTYNWL